MTEIVKVLEKNYERALSYGEEMIYWNWRQKGERITKAGRNWSYQVRGAAKTG